MPKKIAVIGAGIMGNGIAQVIGTAGISVSLYDIDQHSLTQAHQTINKNLNFLVTQGQLDESRVQNIKEKISSTTNLIDCLDGCDMVIEAVPEILELKKEIYNEIERTVDSDVIIASNTSAIPLTELTGGSKYPDRFIITHFMNPATLVPLVEIITQCDTRKDVIDTTMNIIKRIGKSPVLLKKEIPGAVVNRLQAALLREAFYLIEEGVVDMGDIDQIIKEGPGFRWGIIGPMQMVDLGGLDTWGRIFDNLFPKLNNAKECSTVINGLVEEGHLGIKTGKGIYAYNQASKEEVVNTRDKGFIGMLQLKEMK